MSQRRRGEMDTQREQRCLSVPGEASSRRTRVRTADLLGTGMERPVRVTKPCGGLGAGAGPALWLLFFFLSAWAAQAAPSRAGGLSSHRDRETGLACSRHCSPATRSSFLPNWSRIEQVLIGEAVSEGSEGMWRVACVMQARQWEVEHGFSAARRADLSAFVSRQPARVRAEAHRIVSAFFRGGDASRGGACSTADHYLTAALYDSPRCPRWATQMTVVERFRGHVFLKS